MTGTTEEKPRQSILAAAARHFARKGFEGARVDEIASHAGVNKAVMYYHMGDKTAIYEAVLEDVLAHLADNLAERVGKAKDPEQKLRLLIRTIAQNLDRNPEIAPLMLRELASGGSHIPPRIFASLTRVINGIHTILMEGKSTRVFRKANPIVVHMSILGSLMYFAASQSVRSKVAESQSTMRRRDINLTPETAAEQFENLVLGALKNVET